MRASALRPSANPRLPQRTPKNVAARPLARRTPVAPRALPELFDGAAVDALASLLHHAPLAYEPVAAPCSLMNCGDVIYRRCGGRGGRRGAQLGPKRGAQRCPAHSAPGRAMCRRRQ